MTATTLSEWIICPECNHADILDAFDVGGADEGNAFCPACTAEINLSTAEAGDPVECLLGKLEKKYRLDPLFGELREAIAEERKNRETQTKLF